MWGSWKTSMFGILAAVGTGLVQTQPSGSWLGVIGLVLAMLGTGGVGMAARDNDKSSEDVGAK